MSSEKKPSYEELERRLESAESALKAIREGRVDSILGEREALVVRLAESEAREAHLKQVLLAIRNVNQLIVAEDDPDSLIQKACENLTATIGYFNAWIALLDEKGGKVLRAASSGFNGGFTPMRERLERGDFPSCMARTLAQGGMAVIPDPAGECADCPLSRHYQGRAGLTHRLEFDGRLYGILSVSVPAAFAHDADAKELFSEVADDLAFALYKIEAQRDIHLKNHIIGSLDQPMSFVSRDYRYQTVNPAYSRFYGLPPAGIVGKRIAEFCGEDVFEREIKPKLDRCLAGETVQYEILVDLPETGPRWMSMQYFPHRDRNGRIAGAVSLGKDVTEEKELLTRIDNQRRLMESLLHAIPAPVFFKDRGGRYLGCNAAFEKSTGKTAEEILGKTVFEIWPETYSGTYRDKDLELLEKGGEQQYEFKLEDAQGKDRDVVFYKASFQNQEEQLEGLVGVILDITNLKQQEARIRLLVRMLDEAPASITVHDAQGRFLFANRKTFTLHGFDEDEFMAINLHDLDVPESEARLTERFRAIFDEGEASFEVEHFRKDGNIFPLRIQARKVIWEGQEAVLSIANDISEEKRAQAAIQAANEKLSMAMEAARQGMWEWNLAADRVWFDDAALEMLGYARGDVRGAMETGTWWMGRVHPDDRANVEESFNRYIAGEAEGYRAEFRLRRKDGGYLWVDSSARLITRDSADNPEIVVGIHQDIAERKKSRKPLLSRKKAIGIFSTTAATASSYTTPPPGPSWT